MAISRRGASICRGFYRRILAILEPDTVLVWNTLAPHSRILQLSCYEQEIPVFSFERGYLPGTLLLDTLRNYASERIADFAGSVPPDQPVGESMEAILSVTQRHGVRLAGA